MTKILVVEDEDMIRRNLVELLKVAEYDVIEAANGSQGIVLTQSFQPDLVICDVIMPDLSGYEVLDAIRQSANPTTAVTPFIFLSARSQINSQRQGMELGADDYLTKPCTPEALLGAVSARLDKQTIPTQPYELEREQAERCQQEAQTLKKRRASKEDVFHQLCCELRDPIANITMAIEMLKVAPTEEGRDRYLQIMQQECARQKALVNQLTQMSLIPGQGQALRSFKAY